MSYQEIMYILQCCEPYDVDNRSCEDCPLHDNHHCHEELIQLLMDYITRAHDEG